MKIGILFSCQQQMFFDAVQALLPDAEICHFELGVLADPQLRQDIAAIYATCDRMISCGAGPEHGPLSDDALRALVPRLDIFPSFSFAGFHPDTVYVPTTQGMLDGMTHHYHSRLAVGAFLAGRSLGETERLYNALVFGRLGYFETCAAERAMAIALFGHFDIKIGPMIDHWQARGCFMHSMNHPTHWAFADLVVAMCRKIGLIGPHATLDPNAVNDNLRAHAAHPVLPVLAARLGVEGSTMFKVAGGYEPGQVPLSEFLAAEFAAFATAERAALEAVPGAAVLRAMLA